ncbi:flagellar export protein FliJ [Azotosporobacter soli]|uniref:flagellar export protein FliJ n=1 Tax=Azotosporobacter soli TaxID=3055040 RepID=UPI0031FF11E9
MHAFRFRLQALLKYRTMQKEQAQANLLEAAAILRQEQQVLQMLEGKWQENMSSLRELRQNGAANLVEMFKLYELYFDKLREDIHSQKKQIAAAAVRHDACLKALAEALKQEKVVEKVREKKYQQYQQEWLAEEQKTLDEIGLQLYVRDR